MQLMASDWVRARVQDPRIASLDASGTAVADGEPSFALERAQVDLTARVLAAGLAHADDPALRSLGRSLTELLPVEDDAGEIAVIDALSEPGVIPTGFDAQSRVLDLWPESMPRPPSRDELGYAAVALASMWLSLEDPRARNVINSGVCLSGQLPWTPASTVAFAIGMGAEPSTLLAMVHEHLVRMIELARSLPPGSERGRGRW